jgi:hypothetical protein
MNQQIQPIYMSNSNTVQANILLQINITSCSNPEGRLREDGFSGYSDEDISEKWTTRDRKETEWQTVSNKRKRIRG